jgi:hypothetical protein
MEIVERNISELIEAEYNPRQISEKQFEQLKDSLKRFGFVDPVLVNMHPDRTNIIIGGHMRTKAAKDLGYTEVPCVELNLTYDQEKELNIRLNKNGGSFDMDALANYFEASELIEYGFEAYEFGGVDVSEEDMSDEFSLPDGDKAPFQNMSFTLADEQADIIQNALADMKLTDEYKFAETMGNENSNGNALYLIVAAWAGQRI